MIIDKVAPYWTKEDRRRLEDLRREQDAAAASFGLHPPDPNALEEWNRLEDEANKLIEAVEQRYINARTAEMIVSDAAEIVNAIEQADFLDYIAERAKHLTAAKAEGTKEEVLSFMRAYAEESHRNCVRFILFYLRVQLNALNDKEKEDALLKAASERASVWYWPDKQAADIIAEIRDALERGETPKITIKRPDAVEYPIDKINANVWNLLKENTGGQITFAVEKKGSKTALDIYYSIDFGDLEETGISITKKLSSFDKRVYVATAALFNASNDIITLTQIHYAMGNNKRPADDQLKKIRNSVTKMLTARITVDNTSEAAVYTKYGRFKYNGVLLPVEFVEQYNIQGSLTEAAIHIFREPPLIAFSKQRKQITTVPLKVLQSPLNKTEAHLAIDDYLIERIKRLQHGKEHGQSKLLYKTIAERVNQTKPKQRQRLPGTVKRYLDHYKECGMITRYTEAADGVTIYY